MCGVGVVVSVVGRRFGCVGGGRYRHCVSGRLWGDIISVWRFRSVSGEFPFELVALYVVCVR